MGEGDPDHALVLRVAQGDMCAYRELVGKHLSRGVKVAERVLGNRQDAEDVMQEACLKIWREAPNWQPRAKFSTWLYRVVVNACLDRKRRVIVFADNEILDTISSGEPMVEDRLIEAQSSKRVQDALQALPDRQRVAIVLCYYEELDNQEAAACMNLGLGAYQQLLHRAKHSLRTKLGEQK